MNVQQIPGEKNDKGVFSTLNDRLILWTDAKGVTHCVEGTDVHPGVRLLWTKCERDVPAGKAFLPGDGQAVDCPTCLAR
jgi:phenylpropionate dioxygenase-like ring-hydroxylating dioxygenase large terminal subunit